MAKRNGRKNNDGISNNGFHFDWKVLQSTRDASALHAQNWEDTEAARNYLKAHQGERMQLMMTINGMSHAEIKKTLQRILRHAEKSQNTD